MERTKEYSFVLSTMPRLHARSRLLELGVCKDAYVTFYLCFAVLPVPRRTERWPGLFVLVPTILVLRINTSECCQAGIISRHLQSIKSCYHRGVRFCMLLLSSAVQRYGLSGLLIRLVSMRLSLAWLGFGSTRVSGTWKSVRL